MTPAGDLFTAGSLIPTPGVDPAHAAITPTVVRAITTTVPLTTEAAQTVVLEADSLSPGASNNSQNNPRQSLPFGAAVYFAASFAYAS